jgi:serine/threonine protein kinase
MDTPLHQPGDIIAHRYQIRSILGQGGLGITYAADDLERGERVALKALSLRRIDDFKAVELFEREARILAQLNHPAIPRYLNYFQVDQERDRLFYIVQQLAEGSALSTWVEQGWRSNEREARHIASQALEILIYLQQLTPPVIHRDIKPQNLIYRADGRVFLVDFGAVQDTYHNTVTGGSTVIGTYGYMAPEQFRGHAVLATDLYGLGTTLLFLLTRKAPTDLPQRKLKINFRSQVRVSQPFANWLERLIEPVADDRFLSAAEALAVLQGERALQRAATKPYRPSDSPITLIHKAEKLIIDIPAVGLRSIHSRWFILLSAVWNGFWLICIWLSLDSGLMRDRSNFSAFDLSRLLYNMSFWLLPMTFGLVGVWMVSAFLLGAVTRTTIEIDQQSFWLQRQLLRWSYRTIQGQKADIVAVKLHNIGLQTNKEPITVCAVQVRQRKHRFSSFLTEPEKLWLVAEINNFLGTPSEEQ